MAAPGCRLYLVTPPQFDPTSFSDTLARALDGGEVACIRLRLANASDGEVRRAADALLPIARSRGVPFLLSDRTDLAALAGVDGVHLGGAEADLAEARQLLGPESIVGACGAGSRHQAIEAADQGADYVAFGGPATTPLTAVVDMIQWWSEIFVVPCVGAGGITAANCGPLVRAGTDFLAVGRAVWEHPEGPAAAVQVLATAIAEASS